MQTRDQSVTPPACSSIACNVKRHCFGRKASWTYTTLFIDHVPYTAKTRRMFYSAHKRISHVADGSIDIRRRWSFLQALRLKVSKHSHRFVRRVSTISKIVFPFVPLCHDPAKSADTTCGDDRARALRLDSLQGLSPSRRQIRVMSCLLNLVAMMKGR